MRLEAVKALVAIYAKEDYLVTLQSFTERFKPRLVEMATCDTELPVRVTVIHVLCAIDAHGLLEDEQREKLSLLVFDADAKVRRAVSDFVRGIWQEAVDERLVGKKRVDERERAWAGHKALAQLLVQWCRTLDASSSNDADGESSSQEDGPSTRKDISPIVAPQQKSRIALAVEALWEEVPAVSDWSSMLALLLLDHSSGVEPLSSNSTVSSRRKKPAKDEAPVDEAWRLEEIEESTLLEVLVSAVRKTLIEAESAKKAKKIRSFLDPFLTRFFAGWR